MKSLIRFFLIILIFLIPIDAYAEKYVNMAKVPRSTFIPKDADGIWYIFMDAAILLDGFFGIGRYEPKEAQE